MIDTRYATLDQRPEAFNAVGVDFPTHILFSIMANTKMIVTNSGHGIVARELVSKEGSVSIYILDCERNDSMPFYVINYFGNDFAVPLGSTDDIIEYGGREADGYTTIEFKRALVTGDQYDNELGSGNNQIIWAFGSSDSLSLKHSQRGYGQIDLPPR